MTFFTKRDIGRVYVMKIVLPGNTVVYKVGMTNSSRSTDRMMEILRSWFTKFRFVPYCELRLDMECHNPGRLEKHIHNILAGSRFVPNEKIDGGTEMFTGIDEFRLIHYLRVFNQSNLNQPIDLTEQDYINLHKLLVPNG